MGPERPESELVGIQRCLMAAGGRALMMCCMPQALRGGAGDDVPRSQGGSGWLAGGSGL